MLQIVGVFSSEGVKEENQMISIEVLFAINRSELVLWRSYNQKARTVYMAASKQLVKNTVSYARSNEEKTTHGIVVIFPANFIIQVL